MYVHRLYLLSLAFSQLTTMSINYKISLEDKIHLFIIAGMRIIVGIVIFLVAVTFFSQQVDADDKKMCNTKQSKQCSKNSILL